MSQEPDFHSTLAVTLQQRTETQVGVGTLSALPLLGRQAKAGETPQGVTKTKKTEPRQHLCI